MAFEYVPGFEICMPFEFTKEIGANNLDKDVLSVSKIDLKKLIKEFGKEKINFDLNASERVFSYHHPKKAGGNEFEIKTGRLPLQAEIAKVMNIEVIGYILKTRLNSGDFRNGQLEITLENFSDTSRTESLPILDGPQGDYKSGLVGKIKYGGNQLDALSYVYRSYNVLRAFSEGFYHPEFNVIVQKASKKLQASLGIA